MPTLTVTNGSYLVEGIQLTPRRFIAKRVGDFILWLFFHRLDSTTTIKITGLAEEDRGYPV